MKRSVRFHFNQMWKARACYSFLYRCIIYYKNSFFCKKHQWLLLGNLYWLYIFVDTPFNFFLWVTVLISLSSSDYGHEINQEQKINTGCLNLYVFHVSYLTRDQQYQSNIASLLSWPTYTLTAVISSLCTCIWQIDALCL